MNRIPYTLSPELEALVNAIAHAKPEALPVEALLFDGFRANRHLRRSLFEMHERRRQVAVTSEEPPIAQRINYWQEVLAWVQSHGGRSSCS
jgi:hypothetical protein